MTQHATLGASASPRWRACPGSVREINKLPQALRSPKRPSALEGNAAHAVCEWCLKNEEDARVLRGQWAHPEGTISNRALSKDFFEIDQEMVDAVQVYLDVVRSHRDRLKGSKLSVETMVFPISERKDHMFGTADAIIIQEFGELVVIDFKYGVRHIVDPTRNDQALFYALGALERVGDDAAISQIRIIIVQPRGYHEDGVVREWVASVEEVRAEADQLRSAAAATEDPIAPLIPGDAQCQWCPAAATCPALGKLAISTAVEAFPDDLEPLSATPVIKLPDPNDPEQMALALKLCDVIEFWPREVRRMAFHAAQNGLKIPGQKLVRTLKNRVYKDKTEVRIALQKAGFRPDQYQTEPDLKSPAQLEKVTGKKWMADFVERPEGELALVPDTDKRPAELPAIIADYPEDI